MGFLSKSKLLILFSLLFIPLLPSFVDILMLMFWLMVRLFFSLFFVPNIYQGKSSQVRKLNLNS